MAARAWIFAVVSLLGCRSAVETPSELIVWNVGQGQWVTVVDEQACWHFDMGGEFAPWSAILAKCRSRSNRVSLSHWDWDHIGFVSRAKMHLPDMCLLDPPLGVANERKTRTIRAVPNCTSKRPFESWSDAEGNTANSLSRVTSWLGVVTPGDSTTAEERLWASKMKTLAGARVLIAGHHGSRTSTSDFLLSRLPGLRLAIASQRKRRYGHPHPDVVKRLFRHRIPLLLTEDWGTIRMKL